MMNAAASTFEAPSNSHSRRGASSDAVVLVVDDVPANLLALEGMLRRPDLTILTAASARDALEMLLKHDVALAIIDVMMPEMDGFELARLVRGVERTKRVPIIFVTASAKFESRMVTGYALGAIDFIFKPLNEHVLQTKVDVLVALWRQQREADRARKETELLLKLARATSEAESPREVYQPALDTIRGLLGVDHAAILRLDEQSQMRVAASLGLADSYRSAIEGRALWPADAKDPQPVLMGDASQDETMAEYQSLFAVEGVRAVGFLPLFARGLLGMLLVSWERAREFSEHDKALATMITSQLANALERLHLRETERRGHLLIANLQHLTSELNTVVTPQAVAAACIPIISTTVEASAVSIYSVSEDGRALSLVDATGVPADIHQAFTTIPLTTNVAATDAARFRRALFFDSPTDYLARYPQLTSVTKPHGTRAVIPMLLGDRVVGTIGIAWKRWAPVAEEDKAFLLAAADHCAQALERARLQESERRAYALLGRLQQITEALNAVASVGTVASCLPVIGGAVGAEAGAMTALSADGREIETIGTFGAPSSLTDAYRRVSIASTLAAAEAIRTREPVVIESLAAYEQRFPDPAARLAPLALGTRIVLPLTAEERVIGTLGFGFSTWRTVSQPERDFMLAAARQCALALERARLHDAEHTARIAAEMETARKAFLAEASAELAKSLDFDTTLRSIAHLAVPTFADWCAVDLRPPGDGEITRIAVVHRDPERVEFARDLRRRYPPPRVAPQGVSQVIRSGRSELYRELPDELLAASAHDEEHLRLMRQVGMKSVVIVPMSSPAGVLGAITFVIAESGRSFDEHDLAIAEELGRRAGAAIENARSFEAEQNARKAAQIAERRLSAIQLVSDAALAHLEIDPLLTEILGRVRRVFSCDTATVLLVYESGTHLEVRASDGLEAAVWGEVEVRRGEGIAGKIVSEARSMVVEDVSTADVVSPIIKARLTSMAGVPILADGAPIGVLHVGTVEPRKFSEADIALLEVVAGRVASAVERARAYEARRLAEEKLRRRSRPLLPRLFRTPTRR